MPYRGGVVSFTGKTVLILEDEPIIAMGLEDMLLDTGAEVVVSASVPQALTALEKARVDCAVLDVNLHGAKSYPVAARLNELRVPFIFATGYGDAEHPAEFADWPTLTKPYRLSDIRTMLECGD